MGKALIRLPLEEARPGPRWARRAGSGSETKLMGELAWLQRGLAVPSQTTRVVPRGAKRDKAARLLVPLTKGALRRPLS